MASTNSELSKKLKELAKVESEKHYFANYGQPDYPTNVRQLLHDEVDTTVRDIADLDVVSPYENCWASEILEYMQEFEWELQDYTAKVIQIIKESAKQK